MNHVLGIKLSSAIIIVDFKTKRCKNIRVEPGICKLFLHNDCEYGFQDKKLDQIYYN